EEREAAFRFRSARFALEQSPDEPVGLTLTVAKRVDAVKSFHVPPPGFGPRTLWARPAMTAGASRRGTPASTSDFQNGKSRSALMAAFLVGSSAPPKAASIRSS